MVGGPVDNEAVGLEGEVVLFPLDLNPVGGGQMPDRQVLDAALETVGLVEPENARVLRIRNTLDLGKVLVSEAYLPQVEKRDDLSLVEAAKDVDFDDKGDLLSWG